MVNVAGERPAEGAIGDVTEGEETSGMRGLAKAEQEATKNDKGLWWKN